MAKKILGKVALNPRGEYVVGTTYDKLDVVTNDGSSYLSKVDGNKTPLTNTTNWQLIASKGKTGSPGNLPETVTPSTTDSVSDGIYYAQTAGTYSGIVVREEYYTLLRKENGVWSIASEVKMPYVDKTSDVNGDSENLVLTQKGGNTLQVNKANNTDVGIDIIEPETLAVIDFLKGLDRTDVSVDSEWQSGYINVNGNVSASTSYICTRNFIPLKKGIYKTNLLIDTNTAVLAVYDTNYVKIATYGTNGDVNASVFWDFELPVDGFIKFSYAKYYDSNVNIVKLEDRTVTNKAPLSIVTDDVFVKTESLAEKTYENLGLDIIPKDTNFISELTGSLVTNTDLWEPGYINSNGGISNGSNWYHTVKLYPLHAGVYNYQLCFSGNAKVIIRNKENVITQVIERLSGNSLHTGTITVTEESTIQISHVITSTNTYTEDLYIKNTTSILPGLITTENIKDYASNNAYRQILKDSHKPRIKRKIVSFISDDGYASEYNWFCPLLEEYGIKATLAIVRDWVGNTEVGNMMTAEQIIELHNRGHEIASHTSNHGHLNAISSADAHSIISTNKTYLEELLNCDCETFISPFGENNKTTDNVSVQKIVSAYHDCNVITGYGSLNTPPIDSYFLNRVSFDLVGGQTSRFPDILQPIIDDSTLNDNWLMFAFHSARGEYTNRRQELRDMIDYLLSEGYEFMTVRNAMRYYKNPVEIGVKNADVAYYKLGIDGSEENVNYF